MSEYPMLGSAARGTIQARDNQQDRLKEFLDRLATGEFHVAIPDGLAVPARCVDGRNLPKGVIHPLAPNAAGGSESIFVADDLTMQRFGAKDISVAGGYANTLQEIMNKGYEIGGHTDSYANGAKSGCGANDRLGEIYRYISSEGAVLREMAQALGVAVDAATHEHITKNAAKRTTFTPGAEVFAILSRLAKPEFIDVLDGEHNEVAVIINKKVGTTLDRRALAREFGVRYEAFNADIWSFKKAAEIGSKNSEETYQKLVAMVYYNLATTLVLGGPNLRMIILEA